MTTRDRRPQYARPFWLPDLEGDAQGQSLERIALVPRGTGGPAGYDEACLQRLIHRHPQSLPVSELEPTIGEIVPVAMEVPTSAGVVDNVFVSPNGSIVLAECKLWRNPEARRRVIGQIIDYAQSISRWSYTDFDAAVRRGVYANGRQAQRSLIEVVGEAAGGIDEIDEAGFIDAVQRNLRLGRFLLLVVGDGVREASRLEEAATRARAENLGAT